MTRAFALAVPVPISNTDAGTLVEPFEGTDRPEVDPHGDPETARTGTEPRTVSNIE